MPLNSMTGFGRAAGSDDKVRWVWELRSVNGRGLDVRVRMPPGYEALEPRMKNHLAKVFARGNVTAQLTVQATSPQSHLRIDKAALDQVLAVAHQLRSELDGPPLRVEAILGLRGVLVLEDSDDDEAAISARQAAMWSDFETACDALCKARGSEGARLHRVVAELIATMSDLTQKLMTHPARTPETVRARLKAQMERLLGASGDQFDPDRLYQEAALIATRADIEEELQRLRAHVAAAIELLDTDEPVGRRLDFLMQEFNREANTICSKANDAKISALGLELKAGIDRMREQIQNVE